MANTPIRIVLAAMTILASVGFAQAQDIDDRLRDELASEGYAQVSISRTLLGRIRIIAVAEDGREREIILNPHTGVVMRDFVVEISGESVKVGKPNGNSNSNSNGRGNSGGQPNNNPNN